MRISPKISSSTLLLALSLYFGESATAGGNANRCAELFLSGSKSSVVAGPVSKVDLLWQVMIEDRNRQALTDSSLLQRAVSLSKDMSVQERIEFTERCMTRQEGQSQWMAGFLLEHLLKTRNEDPIHGLTGDQLFSLFKTFEMHALAGLAQQNKRFFPVLTQKQIDELTQIYTDRHPVVMNVYGDVFGMSESQKIAVFMRRAHTGGRFVLRESQYGTDAGRNVTLRQHNFFPIDLPISAERRILRKALASDGLLTLEIGALKGIPQIENDTPLEAPPGERSIRSTVEQVARKYSDLIHPSEAQILWDRVKSIEVGFRILLETAKLTERGVAIPRTSLEVLGLALGYNASAIDAAKLSDRQTSQLYELSLDLSSNLDKPPFDGIAVDPSIWQPKQIKDFLDLLGNLRDLTHLYGNNQHAWDRVVNETGVRNGLRPDLLADLKNRTRETVVVALENAFRETNITIARKELDALYSRWGSIEPIITLVARFKGNESWREEIPALAKVLQFVLSDRFSSFKYEGDPANIADQQKANEQLQMLTTEQARTHWKINLSKLDLYDPNTVEAESDAGRLARARTIVKTNLYANLRGRDRGLTLEGAAKETLIAQVVHSDKTPAPRALLRAVNADAALIERTLLRLLVELNDATSMRKVASYLKGNATSFNYEAQTISDLSSIVSTLTPQRRGAPAVIFTTTFDNPKMLVTIGDLVDASSCQNYRTGSHIQTLLGYVMDAGVKGLVSYVLKPGHFAQQQEYNALVEALQAKASGENIEVKGDLEADKGIVHLRISRAGQQNIDLQTVPLSKAQLRMVIKLGQTGSGQPGLFFERPYEQSHSARPVMISHVNQIRHEIASSIGGVIDQEIDIPASRNVGGVYSDAGGGVQTHLYRLRPLRTPY